MGTGTKRGVEVRKRHFLGGEYHATPNNQQLTLPAGTTEVDLLVTGATYFAVNRAGAGVNSHGYVSANSSRQVGPLDNLETMHVHSPAGNVHVMYYREA